MALNAEWHATHVMPKNATPEQRASWHVSHAKHCGCRPMPASVVQFLKKKPVAKRRSAGRGARGR